MDKQTPRNTLYTGIPWLLGCGGTSLIILIIAGIAVFSLYDNTALGSDARGGLLAVSITAVGLAILGLLIGFGSSAWLWQHGKVVDKLLKGEGVIAKWDWDYDENGSPNPGYVLISRDEVYKSGNYFEFKSVSRRLVDIQINESKTNPVLLFTIRQVSRDANNIRTYRYPQVAVPIPEQSMSVAQQVVQTLQPTVLPDKNKPTTWN